MARKKTQAEESFSVSSEEVKFTKSASNPEAEAFEGLVDEIRKAIRSTVDYQKKINDTDPVTIQKKTGDTIKAILRASKWA